MTRAGVGSGRRPTGSVRRGAAVRTGVGLGVGAAVGATVGRAVGVGTGDGVAVGAPVALGLGFGDGFEDFAGDGVTDGDAAGVGAPVGDAVGEGAMFVTVFCFFGAFAKRANAMPKNHPAITTTTAAAMVIAQPFPPPDERRGPDGVSRRRRPRSSSFTLNSLSEPAGRSSEVSEDYARDYGARARRSPRSRGKRLQCVCIGDAPALVSSALAGRARSHRRASVPRTFHAKLTRDHCRSARRAFHR